MRFLYLFFVLLTLTACKQSPPKTWTVRPAGESGPQEIIHLDDPARDLAESLKAGDHRFIGIMGNALNFPGVPNNEQSYIRSTFGAKVVDGISDVENETSKKIGSIAREYAVTYNHGLMQKINPASEPSPSR